MTIQQQSVEQNLLLQAVNAIADSQSRPILYGPNGKPLQPTAAYSYRRDAARRTGSLKNWIPQRLFGSQAEALERRQIVERAVDLVNNDPHAAGIVDNFASTVVGSGLSPHPSLDLGTLPDLSKETARGLQARQRMAYMRWSPFADAGGRMSFGQIQYLVKSCMLRYGEYFCILPMLKDPVRPYSLACLVINPLRVKTPTDKTNNPKIRDGIELGSYGEPRYIWVKKSSNQAWGGGLLADTSENFLRIPVKKGHRLNVLHGFVAKDAEQVRGWPYFAPAMKYFRDHNDLLNAELVSSVVTAALSWFIEKPPGVDFGALGTRIGGDYTDTRTDAQGSQKTLRYEEVVPGQVWYGAPGEKPNLLSAQRPGTTFEPFVKTIKKTMSMCLNIPYPILFKDAEGLSFAGWRGAMLDAWRVYTMERTWLGADFCQPVYTMLQEEAYLKSDVDYPGLNFYEQMPELTRADWRGAPKGDIEPIKAIKAYLLAIKGNLMSRSKAIAELGDDWRAVFEQLEEESELMTEKNITGSDETDAGLNDPDIYVEPAAAVSMGKIWARLDEMTDALSEIRDHLL